MENGIPFRQCRFDRRAMCVATAWGLHAHFVMLEALARNWSWLLFRAVLAVAYGIAVFAWSNMTLVGFVYLFGLYAVCDGIVSLAIALDVKALPGFGSLLFESLVRIAGGFVAMGEPAILITFPRFIAGWSILTGIAEGIVAFVLRRELTGEWPLPFAGAVSILIAILILVTPGPIGVPALRWLLGPYSIIFGVTLFALARRLRQLAEEMQAA
jgi:uncharacterized membrane protein HdeD (DUF308 family)